jgi:hypothetical protein
MKTALHNIGYAARPIDGETVCGDQGKAWLLEQRIVLALADGLGHGPGAAHAATAALACIDNALDCSCEELFALCDKQLRSTRGVAMSIAILEPVNGQMRMFLATVGNIRVQLITPERSRFLPMTKGIVGAGYASLQTEEVLMANGDRLVLYSDGFEESLPLSSLLIGESLDAQSLADTALKSWAIDRDDASILVYQMTQPGKIALVG